LSRDPGTQWAYSNVGYCLLGLALANKAGTTYDALLNSRIIGPLGMKDTTLYPTDEASRRLATGHDPKLAPIPPLDLGIFAPAGALRSTLDNLLRFASAVLPNSRSPLEAPAQLLLSIRRPAPAIGGDQALGWEVATGSNPFLAKDGVTAGQAASIVLDAPKQTGVVVLSNALPVMMKAPPDGGVGAADLARHLIRPALPVASLYCVLSADRPETSSQQLRLRVATPSIGLHVKVAHRRLIRPVTTRRIDSRYAVMQDPSADGHSHGRALRDQVTKWMPAVSPRYIINHHLEFVMFRLAAAFLQAASAFVFLSCTQPQQPKPSSADTRTPEAQRMPSVGNQPGTPAKNASSTEDLCRAANDGDQVSVRRLLERGVDTKASWEGATALHYAVLRRHFDIAKLLLDSAAEPNARASNGATPLLLAATSSEISPDITGSGDLALVKLLVSRGARLDDGDLQHGQTPLMIAAWTFDYEIVKYLLDKGADPQLKSNDGRTALIGTILRSGTTPGDTVNENKQQRVLELLRTRE
jgi:hypothetical protein